MDADLSLARSEALLRAEELREVYEALEAANVALRASQGRSAALQEERVRLEELWTKENRLRLECENQVNVTEAIGWGLSGVLGVATLVLSLVLGLSL